MWILDLYAGCGIGAYGYKPYADILTGVDIVDYRQHYPGTNYICQDVIKLDYEILSLYDFIHASPPCQAYSKITPRKYRDNHAKLIPGTHLMLQSSGKPYVIENVEGSTKELRPNLVLHGSYFGLSTQKKRYFYCSWRDSYAEYKKPVSYDFTLMNISTRKQAIFAYGLPDTVTATVKQIRQGIPPCYTDFIFRDYLRHK